MSKQTAVEWLIKQISSSKYFYNLMEEIESRSTIVQPNAILQQAKQMEKEQSKVDYETGQASTKFKFPLTAERYYQETYGGNNE